MKIGAHVSIAGGIDKAPARAHGYGCGCFQIFSRSPRGGKAPELTPELVESYKAECSRYALDSCYIHAPYYTNLGSESESIRESSIRVISEELERGGIIGARGVVFHPGSAGDSDKESALGRVIDCVKRILEGVSSPTTLIVENTAGQGAVVGERFEELAHILEGVGHGELGICLDTAHMFASGYDIRTAPGLGATLDEFDRKVGLPRLRLLHCNDSKAGLGERKDRHEHIGKGKIGLEGFRALVNEPRLAGIDLVVETPPDGVAEDIEALGSLRGK